MMIADTAADVVEEEEDSDNEEGKSGKLRASNEMTEIFNVVLTLAWNEISTEHDSMSAAEQANLMKTLSFNWADLLSSVYANIFLKMKRSKVTVEQLKKKIDSDKGHSMIRKAKDVCQHINSFLVPSWVEPVLGSSGTGRDGNFLTIQNGLSIIFRCETYLVSIISAQTF
jgi:RecA-family ATPase